MTLVSIGNYKNVQGAVVQTYYVYTSGPNSHAYDLVAGHDGDIYTSELADIRTTLIRYNPSLARQFFRGASNTSSRFDAIAVSKIDKSIVGCGLITSGSVGVSLFSTSGVRVWSTITKVLGVNVSPRSVAFDSLGNVIVAGYYGGGPILFLAKLSSTGALLWSKTTTATCFVGTSKGVLTVGTNIYLGTTVYSGNTQVGASLYCLDENGNTVWQRCFSIAESIESVRQFGTGLIVQTPRSVIALNADASTILFQKTFPGKIQDMDVSPSGDKAYVLHTNGTTTNITVTKLDLSLSVEETLAVNITVGTPDIYSDTLKLVVSPDNTVYMASQVTYNSYPLTCLMQLPSDLVINGTKTTVNGYRIQLNNIAPLALTNTNISLTALFGGITEQITGLTAVVSTTIADLPALVSTGGRVTLVL